MLPDPSTESVITIYKWAH